MDQEQACGDPEAEGEGRAELVEEVVVADLRDESQPYPSMQGAEELFDEVRSSRASETAWKILGHWESDVRIGTARRCPQQP